MSVRQSKQSVTSNADPDPDPPPPPLVDGKSSVNTGVGKSSTAGIRKPSTTTGIRKTSITAGVGRSSTTTGVVSNSLTSGLTTKRTSIVEAAIASVTSVVYPVRSNGLIDILTEPRPLLPVEIPPLPEIRAHAPPEKKKEPRKTVKINDDIPFIEGDDAPNPFTYPKNVEQFVLMLDEFKAKVC